MLKFIIEGLEVMPISSYEFRAYPCSRSHVLLLDGEEGNKMNVLGFQEVEASRFQDSRHMKVVRLSALRTSCLYHPGTHFC
jgi:hypothetical protein